MVVIERFKLVIHRNEHLHIKHCKNEVYSLSQDLKGSKKWTKAKKPEKTGKVNSQRLEKQAAFYPPLSM